MLYFFGVLMKKIKAVGLLSGGLDSTLAAELLKEQGIEIIGRRGLHVGGGLRCRGFREHQRGRIKGGLEGCASRVGAGIIDRRADRAHEWKRQQRQHGGNAASAVLQEMRQHGRSPQLCAECLTVGFPIWRHGLEK